MPDSVPSPRIAGIAMRHVAEANSQMTGGIYSSTDLKEIKTSLKVATELLALIAEPDLPGTPPVPKGPSLPDAPAVSVPFRGTANASEADKP